MNYTSGIVLQIVFSVALALAGLFLVRRSVKISTLESHHEVAGFIYSVIGVIYAVVMAFVVLVVWDEYREASLRVGQEAAMLVRVKRNCELLPDSLHARAEGLIAAYAQSIVDDEFPAMELGLTSPRTEKIYEQLWAVFYAYYPKSDRERFWYESTVEKMNQLGEARRMRIISLDFGIPTPMWVVLICGAVLTIGYSYLFGARNALPQAMMVVVLTLSIVLVLILIESLDHPYQGLIRVQDTPFRVIIDTLICP